MAHPFGGFPQLAEYIHWANAQGCTTEFGVILDDAGAPFSTIKITAPDGKHIIILGAQDLRIGPTSIKRYDRRLGLKSNFFADWPDDED